MYTNDANSNQVNNEPEENVGTPLVTNNRTLFVGQPMPQIWPDEPALWFAKLETWFSASHITSDLSKYEFVRSQLLEREHILMVHDILSNPPETAMYDRLKMRLLQKFTESRENKIDLMYQQVLGDRRPSQFLLQLRVIAGDVVPAGYIRAIWYNHLPGNVQKILSLQSNDTLMTMSMKADVAHDLLNRSRPAVAPAPPPVTRNPDTETKIADLYNKVNALTMEVEKLKGEANERSRSRLRPIAHARSRERSAESRGSPHNRCRNCECGNRNCRGHRARAITRTNTNPCHC